MAGFSYLCQQLWNIKSMRFDRAKFFKSYTNEFGHFSKTDQPKIDGLEFLLTQIEQDAEITDVRWAAYMLATVKHECADKWQPITEYGDRHYFDKYEPGTRIGRNLGNKYAGDGYLYRGRGFVMITGRANYEKFSTPNQDLKTHPDLALQPDIAYRIMSYGMRNGIFTGKKLSDYIHGSSCDYENARRVINGTDKAITIKGYALKLEECLRGAETV
jgi:putative chitinase